MSNSNAALWFVDRHLDEGRGDKIAFREAGAAGRSLSYQALAEGTALVAGALARAGIAPEERAACLILDKIEYAQVFWGAIRAGVVPVPLNTLLATAVYEAILLDCRATCLFVSHELLDVVLPAAQASPFLRKIIVVGGAAPKEAETFEDFLAGVDPQPAAQRVDDDCAFWLYSSGSTGQPKGVRHVHRALRATAETYGAEVLGIREDDVVHSVAKIFFAYGLGNSMTFPMAVGATAVLNPGRPTPDVVSQILTEDRPTILYGVPTLYAATLAHFETAGVPDTNLRLCVSAGEALPEETGKKWQEHFGVEILDGVGSTEMLHIFLSNRSGDVVYGTSGVAVPGYDLKCVDEAGAETAVGEVGELLVRGASAAEGYWNQRDKSRATFEGEWTRTGDKFQRLEDGRYFYCGRTDDMFKVSGIWVSPFEVEQAIVSYPTIMEAAVVAARDEQGLEKPKAFVVLKEDSDRASTEAALKDYVKDKIGKWKYPRWIEFVPDLPKTATGKIQRFKLRDEA